MSYEFACIFKGETDKAVQVVEPVSGETLWLPLSQVEEMHRPNTGKGEGTIIISDWMARQKGLL